jgi:hypothetical protein
MHTAPQPHPTLAADLRARHEARQGLTAEEIRGLAESHDTISFALGAAKLQILMLSRAAKRSSDLQLIDLIDQALSLRLSPSAAAKYPTPICDAIASSIQRGAVDSNYWLDLPGEMGKAHARNLLTEQTFDRHESFTRTIDQRVRTMPRTAEARP